jgi:putative drug exporter of the RND superfamily
VSRFLYALARSSFRHRRSVVAAWVFAAVLIAGLGMTMGGSTTDSLAIPGTGSQEAIDLLEERFPEQSGSTARVVYSAPDGAE